VAVRFSHLDCQGGNFAPLSLVNYVTGYMSDVSVLYKSCVSHLAKWTTSFAEFKCFWLDSSVCKQLIGKRMKHESSICLIETFLLMKLKVNCSTNTKTCSSSCKKSINQMQIIVKWWNMIDVQNILQLAIPRTDKDCTVLLQRYGSLCYCNTERFFPWCSHKPKRKGNLSDWTSF